ncbi:MAG: hypothetical protein V4651_11805, partial [Bacteroidota bacterium]
MKNLNKTPLLFFFLGTAILAFSQTNPTAQSLPYSQNFSGLTGSTTLYPGGMQGWTVSGTLGTTVATAAPNGNQALAGGTNASTSGGVYDMNGKMAILSTGSAIKSIGLALNTTSSTNISVSYLGGTQSQLSAGRINEILVQYRVGTSGTFTNISGSGYQNNAGTTVNSGTTSSNTSTVSFTLPVACENQSEVQLRWIVRDVSGSGNRPSLSVDDISVSVSSTPSVSFLGTLNPFVSSAISSPSSEQTFTVSGTNLTTNLVVTPPAGYQVSTTSGSGFGASVSLAPSSGTVATTTTIYARFNPTTLTDQIGGNIAITSTGAGTQNIAVSGDVTNLNLGDIAVIGCNVSTTDAISFVALTSIPANTIIRFTDNGYSDATTQMGTEGYLVYTAPSTIAAGTVISWNNGMTIAGTGWSSTAPSNFSLNTTGEQLFVYQGNWAVTGGTTNLLQGLMTGGTWTTTGTVASVTINSYLPTALGANAVNFTDANAYYTNNTNNTTNTKASVYARSNVAVNWTTSASQIVSVPSWVFSILVDEPTTQPSFSAATAVGNNDMTLNFSGGNGTSYMVVMRESSAVAATPTDGTTYSGVSGTVNFTSATELSSGQRIVYNGPVSGTNVVVNNLTPGTTYHYAIYSFNGTGTNNNFLLTTPGTSSQLTTGSANSNASDIIIHTSFTEPSNIDYAGTEENTDLTSGNSVEVAKFTLRDGGATADADANGTTLTAITLSITNASVLRRLALYNGSTELAEAAVSGNTISFSGLTLAATDNGSQDFSLRASFVSTVTDNSQFSFAITSVTANPTGSTFVAADGGAAASSTASDRNRIEVTATVLTFIQNAINVNINVAMSPAATVSANDANGNRDLDYVTNVSITSTGTLSGTPVSVTSVSGLATFSTLTHTASGTGLQLTAASGSITPATSSTFDIIVPPTVLYSTGFGTTASTATTLQTGWVKSGTQSVNMELSTSSVSSGYSTPIAASGGANLNDGATGTSSGTAIVTLSGLVNTVGYTNIQFLYAARASSASYTGVITLEWSGDGTTWNTVSYTDISRNGSWALINGGSWLNLPTGAENQGDLRFRLTYVRSNTGGNYRIDDFTVRGTQGATPVIALQDNSQTTSSNAFQNAADVQLSKFKVNVTTNATTLSAISFVAGGTFTAGNVTNLKLYSSSTNTFPGGTPTATLNTSAIANGGTVNFSSLNQTLTVGDRFLWITGDIASAATASNTITIPALGASNFTFGFGTPTGTISQGGTITFRAPVSNNTLSLNQTICSGSTPATITGSTPAGGDGSYTYQWISSTTGANTGYANAQGTSTAQDYSPAALTQTTWFKRIVSSISSIDTSASALITVTTVVANNTIGGIQTICSGTVPSQLTGSTPTGGNGTTYTYSWLVSTSSATSGFAIASGTNSTINYSSASLTQNTWYKRVVSSGACSNDTSVVVAITVNPSIGNNTTNGAQTICSGTTPTQLTGSTPTGGNGITYTYTWLSSTISATTGFVTASGTNNAIDYSPSSLSQNTWYKRVVSSGACTSDTSTVVAVTINTAITNNTISGAQTICSGTTPAQLTGSTPTGGNGTTYTYSWLSSTTSATSGFATAGGTNNTANYSPTSLSQNTWYKRVVSSGVCATDTSTVVAVTINTALVNNTISGAQTICSGTTPSQLTGSTPTGGDGTSYSYTWLASTSSATSGFIIAGGTNTVNYSPSALTQNTWYKRVVSSGACSSDTSTVIAITINTAVANNTISGTQAICSGTTPSQLTGSAPTGGNGSNYTYTWLTSISSATSGFVIAGETNNVINYSPALLAQNTWYKRVVSSGACSNDTSTVIAITINTAVANNTISGTQSICSGTASTQLTGSTSTGGDGTTYTYIWLASTSSATTGFAAANGTNNGVNYVPASLTQNTWYKRVVSSGVCSNDTSIVVAITINAVVANNTISGVQTICSGSTPTQLNGSTPTGGDGSTYTYSWLSSTSSATSGYTVASGTNNGVNYLPSSLTQNTWYKRVVISGVCSNDTSAAVAITINSAIGSNTASGGQSICSGTIPTQLTGSTPTGGDGSTYTYSWLSSISSATSGFTAASGTNNAVNYSPSALTQNTWYKRIVISGVCSNDTSAAVAITINGVIANNTTNGTQSICSGATPGQLMGSTPTGGNESTYAYSWLVSANSATAGFTLAAGTNNGVNYSPASLTQNTWYKRVVVSGACSNDTSSAVAIMINAPIANNTSSGVQTICSGTTPTQLTGSTPTGGDGASYNYLWLASTSSSTTGFTTAGGVNNAVNYSPSALTQNTWYKRVVISGACSNDTGAAVTITVNLAVANNTASGAQTICSGTTPTQITGSTPTGGDGVTYIYTWFSSITSATGGFAAAGGMNNGVNYLPSALTQNTWYKRVVTSGTCSTDTSTPLLVTVNTNLNASVAVSATSTSVCGSGAITFTATPTNGGAAPVYQW